MINKQLVRQVLSTLRDDEVTTYKQVAIALGDPAGCFEVGSAAADSVGMEALGARLFNSPGRDAEFVTATEHMAVAEGVNPARRHWLIRDGFPPDAILDRGDRMVAVSLSRVVDAATLEERATRLS